MLELDHIRCVLDIADTGSFSRTAERLGIAQSVVSKRVRRVEEQLSLRIFARTSRMVELTREGRAFLPFAQAMIDAEVAARYAARNLQAEMASQLVLGTYDYLINFRMELMDLFHAEHPAARTEVISGSRSSLFAGLRSGRVDVAMLASPRVHFEPDFAAVHLPPVHAHLLIPQGHRLFDRAVIAAADLHGTEIVYSPSHQDPLVRADISSRLMRHGARLSLAPEAHRASMEHYADIRGLPVLRWRARGPDRQLDDGKAMVAFADPDLALEVVVYASRDGQRPIATDFLQSAACLRARVLRNRASTD